jgi:hypothetical protein
MNNILSLSIMLYSVLGIILIFDTKGISYLPFLMHAYLEMCEAGFDVNVALLTSHKSDWTKTEFVKTFASNYFCHRINAPVGLQTNAYNSSLGVNLAGKSRDILQDNADKYDVFVYQEHDMLVKSSHIVNYLAETEKLDDGSHSYDYMPGFLRYIKKEWGSAVIEEPELRPICLKQEGAETAEPYIVLHGNTHQGVFVLTQKQLLMLGKKCHFFQQDNYKTKREYFSSFSIFSDISTMMKQLLDLPREREAYCLINKVLPAENYLPFSVEHIESHFLSGALLVEDFYWEKLFEKNMQQIKSLDCWRKPLANYHHHLSLVAQEREHELARLGYKHDIFYALHRSKSYAAAVAVQSVLAIILVSDPFSLVLPRLGRLLDEYVGLCEAGFDVDVVLLNSRTKQEWDQTTLVKSFGSRYLCHRVNAPIGLQSVSYSNAGTSLVARNRDILKTNADDYDLFVYQDDDILLTPSHVLTYVNETIELERFQTRRSALYRLGFLQVTATSAPPPAPSFRYVTGEPQVHPICRRIELKKKRVVVRVLESKPYIEVSGNSLQGVFILTQDQLKELAAICGIFIFDKDLAYMAKKEYYSSYALYKRPPKGVLVALGLPPALTAYCPVQKVVPADKYLQFGVERLGQKQSTFPLTQPFLTHTAPSLYQYPLGEFIDKKLFAKRRKSFAKLDCWRDISKSKNVTFL